MLTKNEKIVVCLRQRVSLSGSGTRYPPTAALLTVQSSEK
jgi:hypothetical protein